jgi:hypothetical protein
MLETPREGRTLQNLLTGQVPFIQPVDLPPILYHYTNSTGAIGIIEKGQVWASDTAFLNDPSEITYGSNLINEVWTSFKTGTKLLSDYQDVIEHFVNVFCREVSNFYSAYISCFSEKGDLLSQWRAYGRPGTGFSLGFDPQRLAENGLGFKLVKIEYDRDAQRQKMLGTFADITTAVDRVDRSLITSPQPLFELLEQVFLGWIVCCKNPAYSEEQEWRLARLDSKPHASLSFRPSNGRVIPYVVGAGN